MSVLSKFALPAAAAAAVVLAVSGCQAAGAPTDQASAAAGSTTTHAVSGGNVKACSVLTEQDLTPLLGSDPGPGTDNSDSTTTACAYSGAGVVTIVVDHSGGKSQFDALCGTNQNVSGVADGACLTIVGGPIAAMYILKGPDLISINIQAGLDTKITPEALTALGKIAAARV